MESAEQQRVFEIFRSVFRDLQSKAREFPDGTLRWSDQDIGTWLGCEDSQKIHERIDQDSARFHSAEWVVTTPDPDDPDNSFVVFWLTFPQILLVCLGESSTRRADDVRYLVADITASPVALRLLEREGA